VNNHAFSRSQHINDEIHPPHPSKKKKTQQGKVSGTSVRERQSRAEALLIRGHSRKRRADFKLLHFPLIYVRRCNKVILSRLRWNWGVREALQPGFPVSFRL
jgi:hypothetical protein